MQNLLNCSGLQFKNWSAFKNAQKSLQFRNREYLRKFCNQVACISSATFWMGNLSSSLTNFASSLSPNKINFNISKVESGPWLNQFAQRWKVQILIFLIHWRLIPFHFSALLAMTVRLGSSIRYPGKARLDITILNIRCIRLERKRSGSGPLRKNSKINGMDVSTITFPDKLWDKDRVKKR